MDNAIFIKIIFIYPFLDYSWSIENEYFTKSSWKV